MTVPRAWRNPNKIRECRPKPATDAPPLIPDSKVGQLTRLVQDSGALELIDAEIGTRTGPDGLHVATVFVAVLLALHYQGSALLADASRVLLDQLSDTAKAWLGVDDIDRTDSHARIAFSRRVYRTFDRVTTALDPVRVDRRRRLPLSEAEAQAAVWEDTDPEHERKRTILQQVSDVLVLAPVKMALERGWLKGWPGDVGVDTTGVPAWHKPPSERRGLGSVETTAGWHFSAGADEGVFGHSLTILVAASRRSQGRRVSRHPQLALGAVLDTGGKRVGPNAVHTLRVARGLGLPAGLLAADRAYTDQTSEHFQAPARQLGYQLALDYKQDQRGIQGTTPHGALLIDGSLACPLTPQPAATATTGLDDKQVREMPDELAELIAARAPFLLKTKQTADRGGTVRLQCPAAGPSPSITCPRHNRLHPPSHPATTVVDLTNPRSVAAHVAAKPAAQIPAAERLRPPPPSELPRICRRPTITLHPGDLGKLDKLRQDRHYLSPTWHDAFKPIRANNEGINGRAKSFRIDLSDPKRRLAHGRAAQALLVALMLCTLNLQILHDWRHANGIEEPGPTRESDVADERPAAVTPNAPDPSGRPTPGS